MPSFATDSPHALNWLSTFKQKHSIAKLIPAKQKVTPSSKAVGEQYFKSNKYLATTGEELNVLYVVITELTTNYL